ncbi:hypothetical protein D1159_00785 [Pseudoflavonifractor sp. 524-17]|nr:hypothetical protein [Pseudoflavonifractor sp. 524-17]
MRLSRATPSYNCHSYAWYSQSISNNYWINDPKPYMNDGSYSKYASPKMAILLIGTVVRTLAL